MKKSLIVIAAFLVCGTASAQFMAKVEMKEPVEGICDQEEVYALFPMLEGQKEALCPVSDQKLTEMLNAIVFLLDKPKYKSEGMVSMMINCKGEVVKVEMDGNGKTKDEELDRQIVAVFSQLGVWSAGTLYGSEVDSMRLFSFTIKGGKFILN